MEDRREFLKNIVIAGAGLAAMPSGTKSMAAVAPAEGASPRATAGGSPPRRIDVHHHILPPEYVSIVGEEAIGAPASGHAPKWTVQRSLAAMDANGIATAMTSVSAPGIWLGDKGDGRRLARVCNEFAAGMSGDHKGRFGVLSALPLPDVEASLGEIAYSADTLHCDGFTLMTNYSDTYLGDPKFSPVFDELNRRRAVVFVHPTTCTCGLGVLPDVPSSGIEFPHYSTRAIVSLLFSGTFSRCRDIRFIFSHGGGTLPFLAYRIAGVPMLKPELGKRVPEGILPTLQRLHYDTALSANPPALAALLQLVSASQVLFGSDFPFAPEPVLQGSIAGLGKFVKSADDLRAIERENALAMFPRLAEARRKGEAG